MFLISVTSQAGLNNACELSPRETIHMQCCALHLVVKLWKTPNTPLGTECIKKKQEKQDEKLCMYMYYTV